MDTAIKEAIDEMAQELRDELESSLDSISVRIGDLESRAAKIDNCVEYDSASAGDMRSLESRVDSVEGRIQAMEYLR